MPTTLPRSCAQRCAARLVRVLQMTYAFTPFTRPRPRDPLACWRRIACGLLLMIAFTATPAKADSLASARSAFSRGDYVRAAATLTPLALRGNVEAQAMLGYLYENGFEIGRAHV